MSGSDVRSSPGPIIVDHFGQHESNLPLGARFPFVIYYKVDSEVVQRIIGCCQPLIQAIGIDNFAQCFVKAVIHCGKTKALVSSSNRGIAFGMQPTASQTAKQAANATDIVDESTGFV